MTLKATNEKISVSTSTGADIDVIAHYADLTDEAYDSSYFTKITTATTTDVVPAPGSGSQRLILHLSLTNIEAAADNTIQVNLDVGGTLYRWYSGQLLRGEKLHYVKGEGWNRYDANGKMVFVGDPGTNGIDGADGGSIAWETITDADFNAADGVGYDCQGGDLTGDHSVDVSGITTRCAFMTGQTTYILTFVGESVYMGGGEMAIDTVPLGGFSIVERINGKLICH